MCKFPSMRIAPVSDVHSNLPALEAVLADIAEVGVDERCALRLRSGPSWTEER